jgi:hypothetical protein
MSCPGSPCNPAPSTGSWTFTANPSANRFCDDRLVGLSYSDASAGTNLVSVDPLTGCLVRPAGPKGVWQHDPDGCQPDFAGPLNAPEFANVPGIDATKSHGLPLFESDCNGEVSKLIKQDVAAGNLGLPAMLRDECCTGGTRWAVMAPEFLINGRQSSAGTCVSPRMLGFVPYERVICEGRTVTEYRWFTLDKWQQAEVPDVVEADIFEAGEGEAQNIWLTAWRDEGCPSGSTKVKQLAKLGPVQAKAIFGIGGASITMLDEPLSIYLQHRQTEGGGAGAIVYYPSVSPAGTPPFVSESFSRDLTSIAGWDDDFTHVIFTVKIKATTVTQLYDGVLVIGGREYARVSLPGDNAGGNDGGQYILKIPSNKIISGNFYNQVVTAGTLGGLLAQVLIDGFLK